MNYSVIVGLVTALVCIGPHYAVAGPSPLKRLLLGLVQRLPERLDKVELFEPPYIEFSKVPTDQNVTEGSSVSFQCEVNAIPPPVIRWTFNGQTLIQGRFDGDDNTLEKLLNLGLTTIANGITISKLELECVTPNMAGVYACVAENGHQNLESRFRVEVVAANSPISCGKSKKSETAVKSGAAPIIYMWTDGRFEREGATAQLFCRARGNPEPTISWQNENGESVGNSGLFTVLPSGDLLIKSTDYSLMGGYKCTATNEFGEDTAEVFFYPTNPEDVVKKEMAVVGDLEEPDDII